MKNDCLLPSGCLILFWQTFPFLNMILISQTWYTSLWTMYNRGLKITCSVHYVELPHLAYSFQALNRMQVHTNTLE